MSIGCFTQTQEPLLWKIKNSHGILCWPPLGRHVHFCCFSTISVNNFYEYFVEKKCYSMWNFPYCPSYPHWIQSLTHEKQGSSRRKCREHLSNLPPHRDSVTHQGIFISQPCYEDKCMEWKSSNVLCAKYTCSKDLGHSLYQSAKWKSISLASESRKLHFQAFVDCPKPSYLIVIFCRMHHSVVSPKSFAKPIWKFQKR